MTEKTSKSVQVHAFNNKPALSEKSRAIEGRQLYLFHSFPCKELLKRGGNWAEHQVYRGDLFYPKIIPQTKIKEKKNMS